MKSKYETPLQARSVRTKDAILDAALTHFAERGFEAASLREIGETAGATHPMITYHFGSKDDLWRAAVRKMFERIGKEVVEPAREIVKDPDQNPLQYVKEILVRYVGYCARHPEHARITMSETVRGGKRLNWMANEFAAQNHADLVPMLQQLIDSGQIPKVSPLSLLYAIVGISQTPFLLAKEADAIYSFSLFDDEWVKSHTETLFQLLFRESAPVQDVS